MDIKNKGAIVTGASRGLGRALAVELARAGAKVVVVARASTDLDATVDEIRRAGGEAHVFPADMGNKEDIYRIAGAAAALVGPIDILIHCASDLGPTPLRLLIDSDCEDLERVLAVNLVGPFRLTKAIAGGMALRGEGLVVHISSDAAVSAYPRWGAYGVSKAALDHLSRSWAAELAELGVRVVAIDPGEMDTAMHAAAMPEANRATLARPVDVAQRITGWIARDQFDGGARLIVGAAS